MDRDRKYYQDRALECLLVAEEIRDPAERFKILDIAQRYIMLAASAAMRLDPSTPRGSPKEPADRGVENDT